MLPPIVLPDYFNQIFISSSVANPWGAPNILWRKLTTVSKKCLLLHHDKAESHISIRGDSTFTNFPYINLFLALKLWHTVDIGITLGLCHSSHHLFTTLALQLFGACRAHRAVVHALCSCGQLCGPMHRLGCFAAQRAASVGRCSPLLELCRGILFRVYLHSFARKFRSVAHHCRCVAGVGQKYHHAGLHQYLPYHLHRGAHGQCHAASLGSPHFSVC